MRRIADVLMVGVLMLSPGFATAGEWCSKAKRADKVKPWAGGGAAAAPLGEALAKWLYCKMDW